MSDFDDRLRDRLARTEPGPPFATVLDAAARRRTRRRALIGTGLVVGALALAGTGLLLVGQGDGPRAVDPGPGAPSHTTSVPSATGTPTAAAQVAALEAALPDEPGTFHWGDTIFHFLAEDGSVVDTDPWTACLASTCWDGMPRLADMPSVGSPDALYVAFDYPGWRFDWVTFTEPGGPACGERSLSVRAEPVTDRVFRIDPAGPPGEWQVDVFGRGPEGDAVTSVRWTTTTRGTMPPATATGHLFTEEDGARLAPYGGPELTLQGLAETPRRARVTWTVIDSRGRTVTVPMRRRISDCDSPGWASFAGRAITDAEAASLAAGPVTYRVRLWLDGEEYVGESVWPRDLTDEPPTTAFTFDPALPGYAG